MNKTVYKMRSSWTTSKEFIPMFYNTVKKEFKPFVVKRIYYENTKT